MNQIILNQCEVKYGFENMNFKRVTEMLSEAFWSNGIKIEEVKQGASNSALVQGVFWNYEQVAYSRVISDKTRFAYILDVYVDEKYRKNGIGQLMINNILNHDDLRDVYQWLLITKDAHGVYGKSGFKHIGRPDDWMEIRNERPNC
ncbi:MAG TPA: GNAT family N-acetyltransferase [Spirochaetota bacterium]|nr:GNAT family N-acetyltransferase [Spirochaetota bacterium]HOR45493.1 GNAT family N-acetyltransferase [Spirochaetota bacterium]HPK57160.1 GNAT family N-acetyltransferase [Spirochaetota bacterium]